MTILSIADIALLLFLLALGVLIGYLLLLTLAALFAKSKTPMPAGQPASRFLILVPAHNEERLLPTLLTSLRKLDYPTNLYQIHVVADNCSDATAEIAQANGATAHERFNDVERGKGYALQWLLQRLWDSQTPHDGVVVLDADTVVSPNFLRVMDARLQRGERVVQAYYAAQDPDRTWNVGLRYAALAVLHYLRPQGRMVLGGSAGLKGNGMLFSAEIMRTHEWPTSVTEDIELHMALVLAGERVMFAPDAVVWAEMPDELDSAESQHTRWEHGRLEMARRFVPILLGDAARGLAKGRLRQAYLLFDAAMEHIIPPFSILMALCGLGWLASVGLGGIQWIVAGNSAEIGWLPWLNVALATGMLLGAGIYLLSGLWLADAPKSAYKSLLFAPFYLVWKVGQYVGVLFRRDRLDWIRTQRNAG